MITFESITQPKDYIQKVTSILKKHLPHDGYRFILFGSRVQNFKNSRSDFDFGILYNKKIPLKTFLKIKAEVDELPALFTADIVDFNRVTKDFRAEALQDVIPL